MSFGFNLSPTDIDPFSMDVRVTRFSSPSEEKGRLTDTGRETTFVAKGSFQPMNQKELMRLPEGQRNSGRSKFFTSCELFTSELSTCNTADEVDVDGVNYQVDKVDNWNTAAGYFRYELERLDR